MTVNWDAEEPTSALAGATGINPEGGMWSRVTIEEGLRYIVDPVTGRMWSPKIEHAGKPLDQLRRYEDSDFVGLTAVSTTPSPNAETTGPMMTNRSDLPHAKVAMFNSLMRNIHLGAEAALKQPAHHRERFLEILLEEARKGFAAAGSTQP
jgi:hypothetical protein